MRQAAHFFKGAAANLSATAVTRLALALETMARDEKLDGVEDRCAELEREADRLDDALAGMSGAPAA